MSLPRFPSRTGVPTKPNKTESREVESDATQASMVGFHPNRVDDLPQHNATLSTLLAPRLLETVPELVLERQARQLQSLLSNARTLALVHDSSTIVCPASTASIRPLNAENALAGDWCDPHGNWQTGVNVVLDRNQNRSIDAADNLVFHLAWYTSRGLPPQIQWRSFRDDDQIEFLANGMTNWQNGRFIMCSPTHRIPAKHLIINAAGRSYIREVPSPDCG